MTVTIIDPSEYCFLTIIAQIGGLPKQMRKSLTWDHGKEFSQHVQLKNETGIAVYFADPHSPWQRASNESTLPLFAVVISVLASIIIAVVAVVQRRRAWIFPLLGLGVVALLIPTMFFRIRVGPPI